MTAERVRFLKRKTIAASAQLGELPRLGNTGSYRRSWGSGYGVSAVRNNMFRGRVRSALPRLPSNIASKSPTFYRIRNISTYDGVVGSFVLPHIKASYYN